MKRREFIMLLSGATVAWPLMARAQQGEPMRRIGVLMSFAADDPEAKARLAAFQLELDRLGWSSRSNLHIDYRFAAARIDQYVPLAKELIALKPEVILAQSTQITATLQHETRAIPIVFTNVSDPIGAGFIAGLPRPGGNLTGVMQYEAGIMGKWLAMLKEIAPRLTRVALVANPNTSAFDYFLRAAEAAALRLAIELVPISIAIADSDIENAIGSFAAAPNGGLVVPPDATTITRRDLVIALAARHRLPAVYAFRLFVDAGGLMCYGADEIEPYRLAASYVDRILRGAKSAELPVQAPTNYGAVVNLKTAKALRLDVPSSLLVRADEVIE
jgi:putative tryptophan/tyrosine transport system substrate-binding protein